MAEDFSDKNKDYGLPKVEPQPIQRDQSGNPPKPIPLAEKPPKKDNRVIVVVLSIVGALILASLLYMIFWNGDSTETMPSPPESADRVVLDSEAESEDRAETGADTGDESADQPLITEEPGSIITISQRTNRYYIFVGSYKFRAYAQRHAEKLAADGFAVKLITPDNWVGTRVAVGNYASEEEARVDAQQIRSRYGIEVVISKY